MVRSRDGGVVIDGGLRTEFCWSVCATNSDGSSVQTFDGGGFVKDIVMQWIGVVAVSVFVYLVVRNPQAASQVINSLSSFNTGAISALQGNRAGI